MIGALLSWLGGGALDRILRTVDAKITAESDRDRIKGEIIQEHLRSRPDFLRAGGFWLMLIFALPLAFWWAAVLAYSVLWCRLCIWPQPWSIAALPSPLDDWAGMIVLALFGVVGLERIRR